MLQRFARFLSPALLMLAAACSDLGDPVGGGGRDTAQVSLSGHVQPIFNASCAFTQCHSGATPTGGMNLDAGLSHASIVDVVSQGYAPAVRVVAGDPAASVLIHKITNSGTSGPGMPPGGPSLSAGAIEIIRTWIEQGARDN